MHELRDDLASEPWKPVVRRSCGISIVESRLVEIGQRRLFLEPDDPGNGEQDIQEKVIRVRDDTA